MTATRAFGAAVVALALAGAAASAPPRAGFEVVGHVDPPGVYHGDVVLHREHAYLSSHHGRRSCPAAGVRVFELSNPSRPRRVATFADARSQPTLRATWTEKTIVRRVVTRAFRGELAVTSVQSCRKGAFRGFAAYDVTVPSRPRLLSLFRTEPRGSHEVWLAAARGRAYVYTAIVGSELRSARKDTPGAPDFRIVEVTDPRRPRRVGGWGAWRALGIHPRDGGTNIVHSVITNRAVTRAFLSYWDLGTVILDVRNPERPRYVGRTRTRADEPGNAHSAWLGRGETLLAETHELGGGTPSLWDVSRPRKPVRLADVRLPAAILAEGRRRAALGRVGGIDLTSSVHDPKLRGTTALFSWYSQGVVAFDVSKPRRPRFLARFLPPAARDPGSFLCPGRSCTSVWGVDFGDDYVVASDMLSGLWVLRLRGAG